MNLLNEYIETCTTNEDADINVDVSTASDFTFSGASIHDPSLNSVNEIWAGDQGQVNPVITINECITSSDLIESITFKYRYVYSEYYGGGDPTIWPTMQLRLVSQSDSNNYYVIYQTGNLDTYFYGDCRGEISCYSPLITYTAEDLLINISDANYQFQLVISDTSTYHVHLDIDSFSLIVYFKGILQLIPLNNLVQIKYITIYSLCNNGYLCS